MQLERTLLASGSIFHCKSSCVWWLKTGHSSPPCGSENQKPMKIAPDQTSRATRLFLSVASRGASVFVDLLTEISLVLTGLGFHSLAGFHL